jgi:hypothetical protein
MTASTQRHSAPGPRAEGTSPPRRRRDHRRRPADRLVGRQRWNKLCCVHWKIDPVSVLAALPVDVAIFPLVTVQGFAA